MDLSRDSISEPVITQHSLHKKVSQYGASYVLQSISTTILDPDLSIKLIVLVHLVWFMKGTPTKGIIQFNYF